MRKSIEVRDVKKKYPSGYADGFALNGVTFSIEMGELVGIIGANGSGKTTLARLMNGLLLPTSGQVLINGLDTGDKLHRREIRGLTGMVFQNPDNQIINPIVEEEVSFGAENLGCSPTEVRRRVDWALQVVGLIDRRQHAPHLLSGGEKQRLAVAAALVMRPAYLILDEPTSMLDQIGRRELIECLREINRDYGITVIMISNCMEDVAFTDRLMVLNRGVVQLDLPPWEVFRSPELSKAGLKPPPLARLNLMLTQMNHQLDPRIITLQQMVDFLCP